MTIELTSEEKAKVIEQHIKNVAYSEYNLTLSLIEAQAVTSPNAELVSSLNKQLEESVAQKQALQDELDSLA
jgi:hypothetical protein